MRKWAPYPAAIRRINKLLRIRKEKAEKQRGTLFFSMCIPGLPSEAVEKRLKIGRMTKQILKNKEYLPCEE